MDEVVRDIGVHAIILVNQYDSRRTRFLRFYGVGVVRTWPLKDATVKEERQEFDARRAKELEASRKRLDELHGPGRTEPKP